jgi:hypothetical protein
MGKTDYLEPLPQKSAILDSLLQKADTKQLIYKKTKEAFKLIKEEVELVSNWMGDHVKKNNVDVSLGYSDRGDFETEFKFAGDTIFFMMHTNVFTFPPEHFIHKTDYVKKDSSRGYCGMIMIYNFLSDSIKYSRVNDLGYLLGRIFINKDGHYFMQGKRQYSFIHRDFSKLVIDRKAIRSIVEIAVTQACEFELFAPPADKITEITLMDKIKSTGNLALKTGKRMGFDLDFIEHDDDIRMQKKD